MGGKTPFSFLSMVDTYSNLDKHSRDVLLYSNDPVRFTTDLLGLTVKPFHKEWLNAFENNRFNVLLAPRGMGKTSVIGAYILWRVCRDRHIRAVIVTINQDKANSMMRFIKENLSSNSKLKDVFGDFKSVDSWSSDNIRVRQTDNTKIPHNEPTLTVLGVGSRVVSSHYDLIVLDDITDEENSRVETRRKKLEDWYNGPLIGTFLKHTKLIDIGTRWNEDDIHSYLINKAGFKTLLYRALLNPDEVDEGKKAKVLWPEHLPWDAEMIKDYDLDEDSLTLQFIRGHQGELYFQMQYQNNIIPAGIAKFKPGWIDSARDKFRNLNGIIPTNLKIFQGVDLGGEDKKSDYFGMTTIGVDNRGDVYMLDNHRTHGTLNRQIQIIKAMDEKWNPSRIGIESVAQQKLMTSKIIQENPSMPVIPIKSSISNDRETRMDRLSLLFETNRVYLNPSLTYLIDELLIYPRGKHDDQIDSLSFAVQTSYTGGFIDWGRVSDFVSAKRMYKISKL